MHTYFASCRRVWVLMKSLFHPAPHLSLAPNHPCLQQLPEQASRSDEDTIPRHLKQRHPRCHLINIWSPPSRVSVCLQRTWLNTWRSACWIHGGGSSETECYKRRRNRSRSSLKVTFFNNKLWSFCPHPKVFLDFWISLHSGRTSSFLNQKKKKIFSFFSFFRSLILNEFFLALIRFWKIFGVIFQDNKALMEAS